MEACMILKYLKKNNFYFRKKEKKTKRQEREKSSLKKMESYKLQFHTSSIDWRKVKGEKKHFCQPFPLLKKTATKIDSIRKRSAHKNQKLSSSSTNK